MGEAEEYLQALRKNLATVVRDEGDHLRAAADLLAAALAEGRSVYEFLGGHMTPGEAVPSRRGRPELFVPLAGSEADRLRPGDVLVMHNQYGVLAEYVDLALTAKERGTTLIAITGRADPDAIVRSHPSGTSVADHADLVIDTHLPVGDAAIAAPAGGPGACPTSATIQAALYWALTCGVVERLAAAGRPVTFPGEEA